MEATLLIVVVGSGHRLVDAGTQRVEATLLIVGVCAANGVFEHGQHVGDDGAQLREPGCVGQLPHVVDLPDRSAGRTWDESARSPWRKALSTRNTASDAPPPTR